MKRIVALLFVVVAIAVLALVPPPAGSQPQPPQTPTAVQVNPPGFISTSQTAWYQTSTGGAQSNTVTQPAQPGKTNYCTGFEITGDGATAQTVVAVTLQSGGTTIANYSYNVVAGVTTLNTSLIVEFPQPLAGLGTGQSMALNVATFGAGNTAASVTMHGFTQ